MNMSNSIEPLDRRVMLSDRVEQLRRMIEIRTVEERIQSLFTEGHVRGSTHLASGQEAVSVGIARELKSTDSVTCTYRGHGHALALGSTPERVIGEICGRDIGCAGGFGGSMHLVEPSVGLLPTFAIIGAGLPVACGAALAAKSKNSGAIAVALFGDGTSNIGAFHESLNLASILNLPVIFVCENNLYGEYTRIQLSTPVEDIAIRATSYNIPGVVVDGQDIDAVAEAIAEAADRARSGHGPSLIEMKTYRYSGHSRSDPATYRPAGELEEWLKRDPIELFASKLVSESAIENGDLEEMRVHLKTEVEEATKIVLAADEPDLNDILKHVYAETGAHT
jgi:TPP-dependent pyruvate/acetoin dehydrogenase alpha subunit